MSEDNRFDAGQEETAALFVSAAKKKKAEEEARRKAEEEQARREAEEAEVRRMEAEVEERKRKAEEERLALEEAEKAQQAEMQRLKAEKAREAARIEAEARAKARAKTKAKEERAAKVANGASSIVEKLKNPKILAIIGGAAALIVVLIVVLVVVTGGKDDDDDDTDKKSRAKKQVEEVEDEYPEDEYPEDGGELGGWEEYLCSKQDLQVPVSYPASSYSAPEEVSDPSDPSDITLRFTPLDESAPKMDVLLSGLLYANNKSIDKGSRGFMPLSDVNSSHEKGTKASLESVYGQIEIVDEWHGEESEIYYGGVFNANGIGYAMFDSWYELANNGEYKVMTLVCYTDSSEDVESVSPTVNEWKNANMRQPIVIPGTNTPESAETNDALAVQMCHMGVPVPSGQFTKNIYEDDTYYMWSDDNGACIFIQPYAVNGMTTEDVIASYPSLSEQGVDKYLANGVSKVSSREKISEGIDEKNGYTGYFNDVYGGVEYWEGFRAAMWLDETTKQYYCTVIIYFAPAKDQAVYEEMFNNALAGLYDLP